MEDKKVSVVDYYTKEVVLDNVDFDTAKTYIISQAQIFNWGVYRHWVDDSKLMFDVGNNVYYIEQ